MRHLLFIAWASMVLLETAIAGAQPLEKHPGYVPFEELGILGRDDLKVEINLQGSILKLVAAATRKEEPEFSQLITGLEAVRVRVAELERVDPETVRPKIAQTAAWMEDRGWQVVVRAREGDDEEIYIYTREVDGQMVGLAVLAFEEEEVALINIVGLLDFSQLTNLGELFDIPQLSDVGKPDEPKKAPPKQGDPR